MTPNTPSGDQTYDIKDRDVAPDAVQENEIDDDQPVRVSRKRDFGIIPIPKNKRHDPNLKVHEQFEFTWRMNLILAGAAVRQFPPFQVIHICGYWRLTSADCIGVESILCPSE